MDANRLCGLIEHTCLRPDATAVDVDRLCDEAVRFAFYGVCVPAARVARAAARLRGRARVVTVAGFPLGHTTTAAKVADARSALDFGADEVDMVMHVGALKDGDDSAVASDIADVAAAVHEKPDALVKVILEVALLTPDEIVRACRLAESAGADFVKTSTGFGPSGANVAAVRAMRDAVSAHVGVKAAGGIRDLEAALALVAAGANRIGTSSSIAIIRAPAWD